jgi:hypothetical protein
MLHVNLYFKPGSLKVIFWQKDMPLLKKCPVLHSCNLTDLKPITSNAALAALLYIPLFPGT